MDKNLIKMLEDDIGKCTRGIETLQRIVNELKLPSVKEVEKRQQMFPEKVWTQENLLEYYIDYHHKQIVEQKLLREKRVNRIEELQKQESLRLFRKSINQQRRIEDPKFFWTQKDFDREKGINVDAWDYGDNFKNMLANSAAEDREAKRNWYEDGGGGDEWSENPML